MTRVRPPFRPGPLCFVSLLASAVLGLCAVTPAWAASCHSGKATKTLVGLPTGEIAWRAGLLHSTGVYGTPRGGAHSRGSVSPRQASWLLVLRANRAPNGRCWVKVRLPRRPNDASGWL